MINHAKFLVAGAALAAAGLTASTTAQAATGDQIYKQRCAMCHAITPGKSGPMAPSLSGVVGRKSGTGPFSAYSPAIKAAGKVWTPANLDSFLAAPTKVIPGTRMVTAVPNAADRKALIGYFATLK